MKLNSQNFLVGLLLTSALVMAMLLVFVTPSQKAEASMMSQAGDLVMVSSGVFNSDELLTVLDARTGKMITYGYNSQKNRMQAISGMNLKATAPAP